MDSLSSAFKGWVAPYPACFLTLERMVIRLLLWSSIVLAGMAWSERADSPEIRSWFMIDLI